MYITLPIVLMALVALVLTPSALRRGFGPALEMWQAATAVLLFLIHNKLTTELLRTFQCTEEPIGEYHLLEADLSLQCYDAKHMFFCAVAAIGIVLYTIGIPACGVFTLYYNRERLDSDEMFLQRFGWWYDGYDLSRGLWWWESVVVMRKVMLAATATLARTQDLQVLLASLTLTLCLCVQVAWNPYQNHTLNLLETGCIAVLYIIVTSTTAYNLYETSATTAGVLTVFLTLLCLSTLGSLFSFAASVRLANMRAKKPKGAAAESGALVREAQYAQAGIAMTHLDTMDEDFSNSGLKTNPLLEFSQ